jgi:hypothetical protein
LKKKILVMTFALMFVAVMAAPVMAEPTKGQKVPARFRVIPPPDVTDAGYSWFTKSGVFHGRGHTETYSAKLNISGTVYDAFLVSVVKVGMWNPKQRTMAAHTEEIVYIPSEGSSNGFSGMGILKFYGWDWTTQMWTSQKIYHVWHGFGSFEGQKLQLSYEGPINVIVTGYCLKG